MTRGKKGSGRKSHKKVVVKKAKKFNEEKFYKQYPWVVQGSVKELEPGTKVDGLTVAHGRVCQIKCQETGKLRLINVQDAFQVRFCAEVQAQKARERAAARRKARKSK